MLPKPKHLGVEYAKQFQDHSVVDVYHHRPPYSAKVFTILLELITDEPRAVLDVGCGTGDIARRLVEQVDRLDAVDFSSNMLAKGKSLAGGDHPHLHWIYGRVEEAVLDPPYALVMAAESLHWMEWDRVMTRFCDILTPHGYLAIIGRGNKTVAWDKELGKIIQRFTTNQDYSPYDIVEELEQRNLFQRIGEKYTEPVPFAQSVENYIASFHSRNGFSRERMGEEMARAFDQEVRALVAPFAQNGHITLQTICSVTWGTPDDNRLV